ncbi:MAG: hypothetical protein WC623_00500 [Pedobacter sp.]|uniref:hypothetical protein n=1 Tax=Pedobacter sp. TaxID=1411316 RepID=UPI0035623583
MDNKVENNDHSFSVPEGYFDQLPLQIENGIFLEKLKSRTADTGFNTPVNYFEGLTQAINTEILADRLKVVAPINEYPTVPANYFEQLQSNILSKTVNENNKKQPAKIVRLFRSNILKYASAACFIILSAAGLYFYEAQDHPTKSIYSDLPTEQMLYDIDEQVIIDHIEANNLDQAKKSASDIALETYILNNYTQSDIVSGL